jgi:transcriptional regulator with XRE-family HTH domain
MSEPKRLKKQDKLRVEIGAKVRALRKNRAWTQAELARKLALSQNRLSEIEGGGGSFTAEQLLTILRLFNVSVDHFAAAAPDRADRETADLQNALARFGASHLRESTDVIPSSRFVEPESVVRETLIRGDSSRLVTALAPVVVRSIEKLKLRSVDVDLARLGLERRLGWLVENVQAAIALDSKPPLPAPWGRLYRRASVILSTFLEWASKAHRNVTVLAEDFGGVEGGPLDILDDDIRSHETLEQVKAASSRISRRWGLVTNIQPADFTKALRASRDVD